MYLHFIIFYTKTDLPKYSNFSHIFIRNYLMWEGDSQTSSYFPSKIDFDRSNLVCKADPENDQACGAKKVPHSTLRLWKLRRKKTAFSPVNSLDPIHC